MTLNNSVTFIRLFCLSFITELNFLAVNKNFNISTFLFILIYILLFVVNNINFSLPQISLHYTHLASVNFVDNGCVCVCVL